MAQTIHRVSLLSVSLAISLLSATGTSTPARAYSLVNSITIPGESTDLAPGNGVNINRLGGFGSDLYYDRTNNVYYGLVDRGPGGGLLDYNTRVEKFSLDVDPNSGAISNFKLLSTILLTNQNGKNLNGLEPGLLNGSGATLGLSADPEGFALAPNGNFYISDEYGPFVKEFTPSGQLVRTFTTPNNLLPVDSKGNINFSTDGAVSIVQGRDGNRGFEGLSISPDGKKLFVVLQDPLTQEGSPNGRSSRNIRLVEFDTTTGASTAQYIYQLESIADINDRVSGTANDFTSAQQGRNIGLSAITAINDHEFLVLERDNRGIGVGTSDAPVGSKRIYKIDLTGATDVSNISLAGTNALPSGVTPVSKTLSLDIADQLKLAGKTIPEKLEGVAIGPRLADGTYALILATDNDFSVTQTGSGAQFDVCTDGSQIALGSGCQNNSTLLPSYLYAFKSSLSDLKDYVTPTNSAGVPEPTSTVGLVLAGLSGAWLKRRRQRSAN
jgi:hypothetical protein